MRGESRLSAAAIQQQPQISGAQAGTRGPHSPTLQLHCDGITQTRSARTEPTAPHTDMADPRRPDDIEDDDDDEEEQIQQAVAAPVKPEAAAFISEAEEKADEYKGQQRAKQGWSPLCHRCAHSHRPRVLCSVCLVCLVCPSSALFVSCSPLACPPSRASAETYLTMWNNTTNPKEVSCRTAFDILCWCFGPVSQMRALYRTGNATTCSAQFKDLQTCMKVKAAALKDPEEARVRSTAQRCIDVEESLIGRRTNRLIRLSSR